MAVELETLETEIESLEAETLRAVAEATTLDALRSVESRVTGRNGTLGSRLQSIKDYPPAQRGQVGQLLNHAKMRFAKIFADAADRIRASEAANEAHRASSFDPTLPGVRPALGSLHPVTHVQWQVEDVFQRLGFIIETGPEMETEYYNFEALNIPALHPARDMQDTFWLNNGMLLRTHTSPVQVRAMQRHGPPLRVLAPGRCFRYETVDASHENTFHQVEGLMIDRHISIANLIAMMKLLLREVFGRDVRVRLRPGYFPFVEPGFELDMNCAICDGTGCATCKQSGWLEILPCGMVHPNVLRYGKIDPNEYTGFAFGLGLTRLAMMKFGIGDIRVLNRGDVRAIVSPERLTGPTIKSVD
ncbi:MAG: phenylalanine--tRNA ligase subunit alpha [Phycisphaerales bacterium]|nr:phenylalanine--tRNA ligase subunit alpha [Phycisphaerales bacterium]